MPRCSKQQKGFALLTVIIFLQLFSLLGVLSLMSAILQLRSAHHVWQQDKQQYLSLQIMNTIERKMMRHLPSCEIIPLSANQITSLSDHWWRGHACSGDHAGLHYDYVFEDLGQDQCSNVPVKFYRLTLRSYFLREKSAKFIFQSTIAVPAEKSGVCDESVHLVKLGRQMRRQLIYS